MLKVHQRARNRGLAMERLAAVVLSRQNQWKKYFLAHKWVVQLNVSVVQVQRCQLLEKYTKDAIV